MNDRLVVTGAGLHNLKDVSISLPRQKLIVFTGPSGSGKSSLVFETIHREGQRQYLESLGMVTDGVQRPPVKAIHGLSPSISVGQHLVNRSPRSTVGTATEVFTYLRLLYARIGRRPCPQCGQLMRPSVSEAPPLADDDEDASTTDSCPSCGYRSTGLTMGHFSFNKPAGACPECTGIGEVVTPDLERLLDPDRSVLSGGVRRWDRHEIARYAKVLPRSAALFGLEFDVGAPLGELDESARELLLYGTGSRALRERFPDVQLPIAVADGRFPGVIPALLGRYEASSENPALRSRLSRLLVVATCAACGGTRLNEQARGVLVAGRGLTDVAALQLRDLAAWLDDAWADLDDAERAVAQPIVSDLRGRVKRLLDVGLGYLTLDRASATLSGGEAQRQRLAALLGSGLTGVLYVLDEPTIGLHPRDVARLVTVLHDLRDLGNTVLVVEHDLDVIAASDLLVDMGPGAGPQGGTVVAVGTPAVVAATPESVTGPYLASRTPPLRSRMREPAGWLVVHGASEHNLQGIDVTFPLGTLTAVTGVSGSGKSTLVFDVLERAAARHLRGSGPPPGAHRSTEGWEKLDTVVMVDQVRMARARRSNPATFTGMWDAVRAVFADTPAARAQRLSATAFSFNVDGGRCPKCAGAGAVVVPMHFLPDVEVVCPACRGRRFRPEVLKVRVNGQSIADVLAMTVEEALRDFDVKSSIAIKLSSLRDVGLGYLPLGQPASTLSGGEAQRVKLARELTRGSRRTLYLLDEPTTGLHPSDTRRLMLVLQRLVDAGNTVVVVEHDMRVVAETDWVVDLGPGGGDEGGRVVATGPPQRVAESESVTGQYLAHVLGTQPHTAVHSTWENLTSK